MSNYSIAKYGSYLRDDFDKYSDKDILVISDDITILNKLKKQYQIKGYSVSVYSYKKLLYLSKNGSLFIKHLQISAQITHDDCNQLKSILDNYTTKLDYNLEIKDALNYFKILENIPSTDKGYAWLSDCLYVGLRNYLIFKNANSQKYEFSYLRLIKNLMYDEIIDNEEYNLLRQIRIIKYNYRNNIKEYPSRKFAERICLLIKKMSLLNNINLIDPLKYNKIVTDTISTNKFNSYQRIRLLEGLYISKNIRNSKINKIISNPQLYTCKFKEYKYIKGLIHLMNENQYEIQNNVGEKKKLVLSNEKRKSTVCH